MRVCVCVFGFVCVFVFLFFFGGGRGAGAVPTCCQHNRQLETKVLLLMASKEWRDEMTTNGSSATFFGRREALGCNRCPARRMQ